MGGAGDGEEGMGHLLPEVREVVARPPEERIRFAREDRWIEYGAAAAGLRSLSDLLEEPRQQRPQGLLVLARANNGKSSLLKRFEALNPPTSVDTGQARIPVVLMSMPDEPTEAKFWMALLDVLKLPYRAMDPSKEHKAQAVDVLTAVECRMLMIDEIHDLLEGTAKQSSHALTMLKSLSNTLSLRLVCAGTENALRALDTDDQVTTRFDYAVLPPWRMTEGLRSLLAGMESVLPLAEASGLASEAMVRALAEKADQTIGGYVKLLQAATVQAIRNGKERLDPALIAKVDVRTLAMRDPQKRLDI